MSKQISAGQLDQRISFSSPTSAPDGYGGTVEGWQQRFTRWGRRQFLRGGEDVVASRLVGRSPVVLTVRRDSETEAITTGWKAEISGVAYNIRTIEPSEDRMFISMLAESGVAV